MADTFRRAEVWAQLHQFLAHQDNTSWDIMKNLMPNTVKRFDALMKEASAGNLAANQLREIGTQQIGANPRMETDSRMDLPWKTGGKEGDLYIQRIGTNAGRVTKSRTSVNDIAISFDKSQLLPDYAYYLLMHLQPKIQERARGTAQQGIRKSDIDDVLIEHFSNA